jgi:hypothetical protein
VLGCTTSGEREDVGGASLRLIAEVLGEAAGDVLAGVGTWCSGVGESMTYAGDDLQPSCADM